MLQRRVKTDEEPQDHDDYKVEEEAGMTILGLFLNFM